MPFMVVDQHLVTHPKTRHLARLIHEHPRYAAGFLVEVWGWAIDAKPDGMIGEVPQETLTSVFGQRGRTLLEDLGAAYFICDGRCAERGLAAEEHRPGRFHDWKQWAGKLVEGRERDRLRQEHKRSGHPRPAFDCPTCERVSDGSAEPAGGDRAGSGRDRATREVPPATPRGGISPSDSATSPTARPSDATGTPPTNRAQTAVVSTGQSGGEQGRPTDRSNLSAGRTEPNRTEPNQAEKNRVPPSPRTDLPNAQDATVDAICEGATEPWRSALREIAGRVGRNAFVSFFVGTELVMVDEEVGMYVVTLRNGFARDYVERQFRSQVREALELVTVRPVQAVEYATLGEAADPSSTSETSGRETYTDGGTS